MRQKLIVKAPGIRIIHNGNEIIHDDGMLDQCNIGYYPPVKNNIHE